jgi:hypothetical protein
MKIKHKIRLSSLEEESNGLTITVRIGNSKYVVNYVPKNIIRCAIGEEDMNYLLGKQMDENSEFILPSNDEGQCFSLSPSDFKDCLRFGELEHQES